MAIKLPLPLPFLFLQAGIRELELQFGLPARPKLLQKNSLQKYFFEAINFVIATKTLCIQLKNQKKTTKILQKIIVSGNYFVKNNCFRELFCNNFGQDGTCGLVQGSIRFHYYHTVEFKNDYILGLYYLRVFYRNYFTGLGQLGNIYRNYGVSMESEL